MAIITQARNETVKKLESEGFQWRGYFHSDWTVLRKGEQWNGVHDSGKIVRARSEYDIIQNMKAFERRLPSSNG